VFLSPYDSEAHLLIGRCCCASAARARRWMRSRSRSGAATSCWRG
jgi:hypothetical protein